MKNRNPNRVIFFDTTARDGKQSPGCNFGPEETAVLARQLAMLGIDYMEAGFPVASPNDFESVRRVAEEVGGIRCCALARALDKDIETAARALEKALETPRIHIFIASSDIHLKSKLRVRPEEAIAMTISAIKKAHRYTDDVEFSPEDSSRTGFDFLKRIVAAAISAGAVTINIPDTVGYATGDEFGNIIKKLINEVPVISEKNIVISVHCHNDLGLATANTLAGLKNGARQAECTINGIGERAGNTHFAEIAMNLITRKDCYGLETKINTKQIGPTSRLLTAIINKPVSDTLPIVGANVFRHSSGIHQDGVLKAAKNYEIITPNIVGWQGETFPLTGQSGRNGLKKRLKDIGFDFEGADLDKFYQKFIALADTKTFVYNSNLQMLLQEMEAERHAQSDRWIKLVRVDYHKISDARSVTVRLVANDREFEASGSGNGPVSSVWDAIKNALSRNKLWPENVKLTDFDVGKGAGGVEAIGTALVKISCDSKTAFGRGTDTDIIVACAKAHIAAIDHLIHSPLALLVV